MPLACVQLYGAQLVVVAAWQVPAPSQVRGETRESPMQPPGAHCVPAASGEFHAARTTPAK